ncbi:MAG: restriction endonuclease subunit S, partial [Nitrososphaeria archaeon]|nr:restriction endonuclease subunit S [Nitrososphaeria archaeon]
NDKKYFYYVLKHPTIRDILEGSMSGTSGRQRVETSAFKNLSVPFPLPAEQSRIATVLSWFDDLIENKKRQNEVLEKTAMAIFKSWFIDFEPFKDGEFVYNEELGKEIPKGWEVKPIGEIVKIESGGNAPQDEKYFIDASHRFVRVKHLTDGACVGESDFINEEAIKDYKLKLFKIGSVIFQKSGESIQAGRINFLPFDAFIVNHLAAVDNNKNNSNLDFIYCCLKQIYKELIEESSGTSLPYLRISDIQSKIVVLPPQTILLKFHSFVDPLFQKIITNQKQIIVLRKIRDTLLPLLVFGKLRVESV